MMHNGNRRGVVIPISEEARSEIAQFYRAEKARELRRKRRWHWTKVIVAWIWSGAILAYICHFAIRL